MRTPQTIAITDSEYTMTDAEYRTLLAKLRRFFEWHRCESPEDLAQETIYRGIRRLSEGAVIYSESESAFFLGFARNIVREERKRRKDEPPPEFEPADRLDHVKQSEGQILLEQCLRLLKPNDRALLVGYILDGPEKTATSAGLTPNALRIRISRIRKSISKFRLGGDG
jgi:DNA-directed RNA polymerase specialized sigma24 family protein